MAHARSLRRSMVVIASTLAVVALAAATMLVVFTALLRQQVHRTMTALEGVHAAARIEYLIRQHRVSTSDAGRTLLEHEVEDTLAQAQTSAHSTALRAAVLEVQATSASLFEGRREDLVTPVLNERAQRTYDAIARMTELEVANAADAERISRSWDRTADLVGFALALGLWTAVWFALRHIDRMVIRPIITLSETFRRHGSGEIDLRAREDGASELQILAGTFNELADSQARRQREQLEFVASIAHDFRSPLAALTASTRLAIKREGRSELLSMIDRQAQRLDRLVDELVDSARIQSGELQLSRAPVDLSRVLEDVVQAFGASQPDRSIEVRASGDLVASCDANRMAQVFDNLVSNALKYSPEDASVLCELSDRGDLVRLRVEDHGIGMTEDEQRQLFQPFRRAHRGRAFASGTGLGLYGVKRIVEAHGGHIATESELGTGSVFVVTLPKAGPSQI